jgi:hypothetical protein
MNDDDDGEEQQACVEREGGGGRTEGWMMRAEERRDISAKSPCRGMEFGGKTEQKDKKKQG